MKKIKINENAKVHYESENYFELIIKEDPLSSWVYCFQNGALIKKYRSSEVGATLERKSTACRWLMKLSIEYRLKNSCGEPHEVSSNHSVNHLELLYGFASLLSSTDDGRKRGR